MKKNRTQKGKTDFEKPGKMKDSEIDTSDIPELDDEFFKTAVWIEWKPKQMVSIRLDNEVLTWFKAQGKGYQTKIYDILKTYIRAKGRPKAA
jgi:uncharacterized protein (DUF4415 family)